MQGDLDDIAPVNDDGLSISEDTGPKEAEFEDATEANTDTEVEDDPENDADVDNEIENNGVKNEEQEEEDEAGMISEGDS